MAGRKKVGQLIGKEALTIARTVTGSHAYIYRGQLVPKDVPDEEAQRLLDEGFLAEAPAVDVDAPPATPAPRRSRSGGSSSKKSAPADDDSSESNESAAGESSGGESSDGNESDDESGNE